MLLKALILIKNTSKSRENELKYRKNRRIFGLSGHLMLLFLSFYALYLLRMLAIWRIVAQVIVFLNFYRKCGIFVNKWQNMANNKLFLGFLGHFCGFCKIFGKKSWLCQRSEIMKMLKTGVKTGQKTHVLTPTRKTRKIV